MSEKTAIHLRFKDADHHKAYSDAAKAEERSLNNYLLHLLDTHPRSPKKKAASKPKGK